MPPGILLYSRFWNNFLYDRGYIFHEEPFEKLVNQGMIQGRSNLIYKLKNENKFVSLGLKDKFDTIELHVDVNIVDNDMLDIEQFKKWMPEYKEAEFILEDDKFVCGVAIEKMSKRWYNVVNPDDIAGKFGADTLRMYEMFLGPLEMSKPWNTHGIDGVFKFLRRFWNLFHDENGNFAISHDKPSGEELKALHKTIKKVKEDINNLSFNTSVSEFMICVNALSQLKCNKREILEPLTIVLSPFAPHIAEELWHLLGNQKSIVFSSYPKFNPEYLKENNHEYPIMINGKLRTKIEFPLDESNTIIEKSVMENEVVQKWLEGKPPKKIIVVPKKIINVVV